MVTTPSIKGPGGGSHRQEEVKQDKKGKMHGRTAKQNSGDRNIFQRLGGGLINIITWPGRKIAATIRGLIGRFTHKKRKRKLLRTIKQKALLKQQA
ncbi:MAG: hypothetical protein ACQEP8_02355 [Chlamydiota bacterium]